MSEKLRLIIVSGLSGSGKTVALHTLEDAGYYCIDNLPVALLSGLGAHFSQAGDAGHQSYAVGIDARNRPGDLEQFPGILKHLQDQGLDTEIVFLTADDATLIKRFSETRRRHPLSTDHRPLAEAIAVERHLLSPIQERADLLVDTTSTTLHQLRDVISERLGNDRTRLSVLFQSFGFKHGIPGDADFVFDVRCLPNPHWEPQLRPLTGRDTAVAAYLGAQPAVERMYVQIRDFLASWIPAFERDNRSYLTIAIGCTGGHHRSVYLAERLATHFAGQRWQISMRHRELS